MIKYFEASFHESSVPDVIIENNGTLDDLKEKCIDIL